LAGKLGIAVAVALIAAGTTVSLISPVTADVPVQSAFAVRGPHDDLTEGGAVIGVANTVKVNGVPVAEVNFFGAGNPGVRSELYLLASQIDTLPAGVYPVSPSKDAGTVDVISNLGGVGCGEATGGSVTILTPPAFTTAGVLSGFAADFALHCAGTPDYFVQLRYNDGNAWSQLVASGLPQGVSATVGSTQDATVTFTAHGTVPITPGAAALVSDSWDGYPYWKLTTDGCASTALAPGSSCTVGVQFAPMVANGSPCGNEGARVTVPDGRPTADVAMFSGCVYPLAGQAGPPQASAYFHHLELAWNPPGAPLTGLRSTTPPVYQVYELKSSGPVLVTTTPFTSVNIGALPTGYVGRYEIQAVYDTDNGDTPVAGPMSLPGTATATSTRELLYIDGVVVQEKSLAPAGSPIPAGLVMPGYGSDSISVGADRRYIAAATFSRSQPIQQIAVAPVDGSVGATLINDSAYPFDTDPTVAPDSSTVIYAASTAYGSTTTVLRTWNRTTGTITTVPGGTNLTQPAYAPDGKSIIAVAGGTHLVRLVLASGTVTTVAGGTDATEPAVASDGRIAFVHHTAGTDDTTLAILAVGATSPTTVAGPPAGINGQPSWDPSGTHLDYVHRDAADSVADLHEVATTGGTDTTLLDDGETSFAAPVILAETPDTSAPTLTLTSPQSGTTTTSLTTTVTITWTATDSGSGVRSSDVRYQTAAYGHALGAWVSPTADQGLTGTSVALANPAGTTTCVSVRARDNAGNVSAWSTSRCVTAALDDRSLTAGTGVTRGTSSAYFGGTYSLLSKTGAVLSKTGATGKHVTIVATTCSTCGSVKVYIGSTLIGTISLHASTTHYKVIFNLPAQSVTRTGTLQIKSTSTAHDYIDGFAVAP
jgi:hypothetical protein